MNRTFQTLKLELKTRTPFPVLEFFFLLFFLFCLTNIISSSNFYGRYPEMALIRSNIAFQSYSAWSYGLSQIILMLVFLLAILVSISIAGEYEKGITATLLTLPVTRVQYLGNKCLGVAQK